MGRSGSLSGWPRRRPVGRGEAQLDLVLLGPAADVLAGVGGEVVQDDVERGAVRAGGANRLQSGQAVGRAFAAAVDAPQGVVADGAAAVEVGDAVGAVVGRRQAVGLVSAYSRKCSSKYG